MILINNNLNTMKGKCLYLFVICIAMAMVSCKKDKVAPIVEVEPPAPVVVEDSNYEAVANTFSVSAVLGGAKFDWQNPAKKPVAIKIKYVEDGLSKEKLVAESIDAIGTLTIPIGGRTSFSVFVSNVGGKSIANRPMAIFPELLPEVKLVKTGWTASASSEINDADNEFNGAENIVDDVKAPSLSAGAGTPSFWQTNYNAEPMLIYPHWLIVDMKKAEKITKIGLNAHIDANQGFTAFRLEGSTDGVDFNDIGGGGQKVFSPGTKQEQLFGVTSPVAIRYVKITLLAGSPYPCLGNFEAYARK
ncbi:discoidin domain-containing protein [Pedobacter caeni]|uniref:F5/8 type C domain-containing protein n=1 Tax=Pedobacter caeni TaxID=288992 RepID=A0A1M5PAL7_9SPHI|nr:discoidin domain-containing protein [Pedobacter caeni]SHG98283.1 F5/8 type C domain-containing protein [Pedobacter caeni]